MNNEELQDRRLKDNINTLNSMTEILFEEDPLEKTKDINIIDIKKRMIEDLEKSRNDKPTSNKKGKVKKKALPNIKLSEDIEQIGTSFLNCFILSLVTASIGTGWLLYLINHI